MLFQKNPEDTTQPWPWFTFSTATGRTRPFGLPAEAFRPILSPRETLIAFDDGNSDGPSIYVFDVEGGRTRRLIRGYGAPVWLGQDVLAATAGGPCPAGIDCDGWWTELGRTAAIDPVSGEHSPLALPTTLQEVRMDGVIDVYRATQ